MQTNTTQRRTREAVKIRDKETCQYCGRQAPDGEIDHILAVIRGGSDRFDNLVWACKNCNCSKGDKTLREWLKHQHKAPVELLPIKRDIDWSAAGWCCDCGGYGYQDEMFVMAHHGHHKPDCPILHEHRRNCWPAVSYVADGFLVLDWEAIDL